LGLRKMWFHRHMINTTLKRSFPGPPLMSRKALWTQIATITSGFAGP